jgi:hypothetical protein
MGALKPGAEDQGPECLADHKVLRQSPSANWNQGVGNALESPYCCAYFICRIHRLKAMFLRDLVNNRSLI